MRSSATEAEAGPASGDDDAEAAGVLGPGPPPAEMSAAVAAGLPQGKRRRVVDVLADVLDAGGSGDDEDDDDSDDAGGALDWRRKAV